MLVRNRAKTPILPTDESSFHSQKSTTANKYNSSSSTHSHGPIHPNRCCCCCYCTERILSRVGRLKYSLVIVNLLVLVLFIVYYQYFIMIPSWYLNDTTTTKRSEEDILFRNHTKVNRNIDNVYYVYPIMPKDDEDYNDYDSYGSIPRTGYFTYVDTPPCAKVLHSMQADKEIIMEFNQPIKLQSQRKLCTVYFPYLDLLPKVKPGLNDKHENVQATTTINPNELDGDRAILTLTGDKNMFSETINQDRGIIITPYFITTQPQQDHPQQDSSISSPKSLFNLEYEEQNNFFMGIFDGHGILGHAMSHFSVVELPKVLQKNIEIEFTATISTSKSISYDDMIRKAITKTFHEVDDISPTREGAGTTASLILRLNQQLYVANVGDSQSFIVCYNKVTKVVKIVFTTRQDKPHLPDERTRIESMGGKVMIPSKEQQRDQMRKGQLPLSSRVIYPTGPFTTIALAMSRSIGDVEGKAFGISSEPTINVFNIDDLIHERIWEGKSILRRFDISRDDKSDKDIELFGIVASDGILDHIDSLDIAKYLARSLYERYRDEDIPTVSEACEHLILISSKLWEKQGVFYRDDITLAVNKIEK